LIDLTLKPRAAPPVRNIGKPVIDISTDDREGA